MVLEKKACFSPIVVINVVVLPQICNVGEKTNSVFVFQNRPKSTIDK